MGLTQKRTAELLGIKPRDMRYYCAGRKPAPAAVRLALEHLVQNHLPEKEYHRV